MPYCGKTEIGKVGRGSENKVLAVAAELDGKKLGRIRLKMIKDASAELLMPFVIEFLGGVIILKKLPFTYPSISHDPTNTYTLAILESYEQCEEWVICNFTSIIINNKFHWDDFFRLHEEWFDCPFFDITKLNYELVQCISDKVSDIICEAIKNDYYVYTFINTKFIRAYNNNKDFSHNMMIYGVDEEIQIVYFSDFLNGKLKFMECTFEELNEAYNNYTLVNDYDPAKKVVFIKMNNSVSYKLKLAELKENLQDSANGINLFEKKQGTHKVLENQLKNCCGIDCYRFIHDNILDRDFQWTRVMSLLYAHVKLLGMKIEYLSKIGIIGINYEILNAASNKLLQMSQNNLYLFLKCLASKDIKKQTVYRTKISNRVKECEELIMSIIDEICECL